MDNVLVMLEEIIEAKRRGISVSINGNPLSCTKTEDLLYTLEDATYMRDYIGDERGKIIHLGFDKISIN